MGHHRRHHTVSEGLQRNWSQPGRRIALIDKHQRTAKPVGTRDAFVIPRLLTFQTPEGPSNDLEKAFGQLENTTIPHLRRFAAGARDRAADQAVRAMICLHWARSRSMAETQQRIFSEVVDEHAEAAETSERLREVFQRDQGRLPHPGELREIIGTNAENLRRTNNLFADRFQLHYNRALQHFAPKHLQRIEIAHDRGVEFLFADSPVVLLGGNQLQATAAQPCALLNSSTLWLPLSPTVGVTVHEQPVDDLDISPADAQILNRLSWAYATSHLGGRLGTNLDAALGYRAGAITVSCESASDLPPDP